MHPKRLTLLGLALLCVLVTSALLPATAAAAPVPPGQVYAASAGGGTAWVAPGPDAQLWVAGAGNRPARLALEGPNRHFGAPIWSPDGRQVALLVMPTGTETADLGEWWTVDVASGNPAQRAAVAPAWTGVVTPQVSTPAPGKPQELPLPPAGQLSAAQVPFAPNAALALTPPATIRVKHTAKYNTCRSYLLDGWVTTLNFEDYVAMVVPSEVYVSWKPAALQAQSIAARTYAWYKILENKPGYDVTDGPDTQHMCETRYASTDAAAAATAGQYLSYNGQVILAQYSADNSHPTLDGGTPYLKAVLDPVGLGHARYGHGHGLSQWGAQRWALSGWNAVQILAHYYTGIQVVDPLRQNPLLSLMTPWPGAWVNDGARPGTWLTGATAYLSAYANPEWVSAVTFTAPGFSLQDGNPADGWTAAWPVTGSPPGPITIGAAAVTRTATLSLSGVDWTVPTGWMNVPAGSSSQSVTVNLTGNDQGGSGLASVALGGDWHVRAGDFWSSGAVGSRIGDAAASTGTALWLPAGSSATWQTSFVDLLALNRPFRAFVRLRYQASSPDPGQVARVELWDPYKTAPMGWVDVRAGDFRGQGSYQDFPIDFWLTDNGALGQNGRLQARIMTTGSANVALDRIRVLQQPQAYNAQVTYALEPRTGAQAVVAKLLDGAGNPSSDLAGTSEWTTAAGQTSEWQLISPLETVTNTGYPWVIARVTGVYKDLALQGGAAARASTTGGITWGAWQDISVWLVSGSVAELRFRWPGGAGGDTNRVQFWVGPDTTGTGGPRWRLPVSPDPLTTELSAPDFAWIGQNYTVSWFAYQPGALSSFDVEASSDGTNWMRWQSKATATSLQRPATTTGPISIRARGYNGSGQVGPWSVTRRVVVVTPVVFLPQIQR